MWMPRVHTLARRSSCTSKTKQDVDVRASTVTRARAAATASGSATMAAAAVAATLPHGRRAAGALEANKRQQLDAQRKLA